MREHAMHNKLNDVNYRYLVISRDYFCLIKYCIKFVKLKLGLEKRKTKL